MSSTSANNKAPRLYVPAVFYAYKGSKVNQYHHTALLKIKDVNDKSDVDFYLGKRVAYIYKAKTAQRNPRTGESTKLRCIWGKVTRAHGAGGAVRAKFNTNLPPKALGGKVRVMLYPSRV